jgi:hypothetical protein
MARTLRLTEALATYTCMNSSMNRIPGPQSWAYPTLLLIAAALILWLAPEEQTLGSGIGSVYVHVALIWTGILGLAIAGVLSLGAALSGRPHFESWSYPLTWVALGIFAAGLVMSAVAARVNWGGVFWREPRTNAALQVLALGLIVQLMASWPIPLRLKGFLRVGLVLFLLWSLGFTPRVLHPEDPARTSSSAAIRLTFLGLSVLCSLIAGWLVWRLRRYLSLDKVRSQY